MPKITKMLYNDYGLFSSLIGSVMFLIGGVFIYLSNDEILALLFVPIVILLFIGFLYRLKSLKNLFVNGVNANAVVTGIWFYKGRGRVSLIYKFENRELKSAVAVMKNKKTRSLNKNMQVNILVNPNRAKQVVILDLYN